MIAVIMSLKRRDVDMGCQKQYLLLNDQDPIDIRNIQIRYVLYPWDKAILTYVRIRTVGVNTDCL
jgi:hypothetical protein